MAQYDPIAELYDGYPGDYADDILFFAEEARAAGSPVLEIGAGTGRLSFCLAALGVDVVGLDSSPAMLRVLRRKSLGPPAGRTRQRRVCRRQTQAQAQREHLPGRVWPVAGDMREFALDRAFPLVIVPFRTFLYLLTREEQERALRAMRRHVAPEGKLILAFFVPPREIIALGRTPEQEVARFPAPEGKGEVVARGWTEFEEERQLFTQHITYEWRDERDRYVRTFQHTMTARYVFPAEMPPLLESCGFRVSAAYGDFDRRPLDEGSFEQIWVAVPRP